MGHLIYRTQLRHPDTGHHARSADGTRPDAHLYGIHPGFGQGDGGFGGGNVAHNQVHTLAFFAQLAGGVDNALGVAVGSVNH